MWVGGALTCGIKFKNPQVVSLHALTSLFRFGRLRGVAPVRWAVLAAGLPVRMAMARRSAGFSRLLGRGWAGAVVPGSGDRSWQGLQAGESTGQLVSPGPGGGDP